MTEMFWKISALLSPLLSAALAGWLAYRAGTKKAKAEAFLARRLNALEKIHLALVRVKTYAENRINQVEGNEYAPHPNPNENINWVAFALWETRDLEELFLGDEERTKLVELDKHLSMCRSMERAIMADPELEHQQGTRELYSEIVMAATATIEVLYSEMRNEYRI